METTHKGYKVLSEDTWSAKIYVGTNRSLESELLVIRKVCDRFVNTVPTGLCVTVSNLSYHYVDGNENGCEVGLIQYPRFPLNTETLENHTKDLAVFLLECMQQDKVSIVFPDETLTIFRE